MFSEEVCRTRGYGAYIHPHECRGYVVCTSSGPGSPVRTHPGMCPDGLVFNELLRACDFDIDERCPPYDGAETTTASTGDNKGK
jgi:Chitin binding Peritrophin-A domain